MTWNEDIQTAPGPLHRQLLFASLFLFPRILFQIVLSWGNLHQTSNSILRTLGSSLFRAILQMRRNYPFCCVSLLSLRMALLLPILGLRLKKWKSSLILLSSFTNHISPSQRLWTLLPKSFLNSATQVSSITIPAP